MKQIEVFVDSVYHGIGGNEVEIQELKTEMKSHLLEAVHELKSQGKSEQEAIEIAIERFGGEKEMRSIVGQLFRAQRIFAKWVLLTSLAFLITGSVVFGIMLKIGDENVENDEKIAFNLLERLGESEVLSEDIKNEISSIATQNKQIQQVEIRDLQNKDPYVFRKEADFTYKKDIWVPEVENRGYSNDNDNVQTHKWFVGIYTRIYDSLAVNILLVGIAAYWTLFTIWATINSYHHKRLGFGWIIAFAFLNVFGYLAYFVFGKRVQSKTIN